MNPRDSRPRHTPNAAGSVAPQANTAAVGSMPKKEPGPRPGLYCATLTSMRGRARALGATGGQLCDRAGSEILWCRTSKLEITLVAFDQFGNVSRGSAVEAQISAARLSALITWPVLQPSRIR